MKDISNIILAALVLICCLVVAFYCMYYGIMNGIIEKKIIGNYHGTYLVGKKAIWRGLFLITIGLLNAFIVIITGIFLYKKF